MEEWREVPTIPHFIVSNTGRVKAKAFTNEVAMRGGKIVPRRYKEREISPVLVAPPGYLRVAALRLKNRPRYYVHRLVALAFVDGWHEGATVNHKNGIKTDNRAENLEWLSAADNVRHAWDNGLCSHIIGEGSHSSKLSADQVIAIRKAAIAGASPTHLAIIAKVTRGAVDKIIKNETWVHLSRIENDFS